MSAINLRAFAPFREAHPDVPLTHFLNAAYFTKRDADADKVAEQIQHVLRPIDELGLHIHPWKSLVEAAGVKFRTEPTIWGEDRPMRSATYMGLSGRDAKDGALITLVSPGGPSEKAGLKVGDLITNIGGVEVTAYADIPATVRNASGGERTQIRFVRNDAEHAVELTYGSRGDAGHEISVEAYETDEFQAIVRKSKQVLAANGFAVGASFRAGAWLAGPRVREAIRREGFVVDSSATDTRWHDEIADSALPGMMREIWPGVTSDTQPFLIETPAGDLLEMPDTGALADYVTAQEMSDHVRDVVEKLGSGPDRFVHLGFHQETAARYLPRVTAALRTIKAAYPGRVIFETLEASAGHARLQAPVR